MWTLPPLPALHLSVQTDTDPERAESPTARSSTPSEKGKQKQLLGLKLPTADELSPGLTTPVLRGRSRRRWVVGLLVLGLFVLVKNMSSDMGPYREFGAGVGGTAAGCILVVCCVVISMVSAA
jgi:hypothetical protein